MVSPLAVEFPDPGGIDIAVTLGGSAVSAFLTTLLVGAVLVALAPNYTQRKMTTVREDVVGSFVYGIFVLVALVISTIALFISVIGILVVIPLLVVSVLVWSVGAAIAYLAIAERLVSSDDGWLVPLLVAGCINGALTLTGIGALLSFGIGATGFGAVLRDYLE